MRTVTLLHLLTVLAVALATGAVYAEEIALTVDLPEMCEYEISDSPLGEKVGFEGCGYRMVPGSPMLPTKTFLIALPPGTRVASLDVHLIGADEFAGKFKLAASPEPLPIGGGDKPGTDRKVGSSPLLKSGGIGHSAESYPLEPGWVSGSGSLRRYRYAAVTVCPCAYHPRSGRLTRYASAAIVVTCELDPHADPELITPRNVRVDPKADDRARELFVNFDEIRDRYQPQGECLESPLQTYDYVIITTSALSGAVTSSNFVTWKTSLGYSVRIVLVTDPEIAGQPGGDLAEQIRNFLRAYYSVWGIEYVLMVGNYVVVPMRYCYPNPSNHTNTAGTPGGSGGEVPTDYYYADLSSADATSWDSDGDGYHGEYGDDTPDFMPEVYVGRIPTNLTDRITYALNKTVTFEQDTGAWKNNAIHAAAFWYFTHELGDTTPCMDAAKYLSYIESDIMSGWTVTHYSEQAGLEVSAYPWPAITEAAFAGSWRTGQYAVVNWGAHGWTDRVARKVWDWDDGDGIPETDEISWPDMLSTTSDLDDDYPSIVTSASCLVGCPEPSSWDRLGIKMLVLPDWGPAVGVIASARSPYGSAYWPPGGSESIIYEFNDMMINGPEKVGQAFYNSKFYCTTNYGWAHYAEYINMYTFNLWGDPSLTREGIDMAGLEPGVDDDGMAGEMRLVAGPSPGRGGVTVSYYLPSLAKPTLGIFDVLGRRVRSLEAAKGTAGWHDVVWDGRGNDGETVAAGIYWVSLSVQGESRTVRVVRIE